MLLIRKKLPKLVCGAVVALMLVTLLPAAAFSKPLDRELPHLVSDTGGPTTKLPFPIHDSRNDFLTDPSRNVYDLKPANLKDSVVYDSKKKRYIIYEKIGNKYYRSPVTYTYEEFWALRNKQAEQEYFRKRANSYKLLNPSALTRPKLNLGKSLFNRLFGQGPVSISPTGNADFTIGWMGQNIKNPTFPEQAQKNGSLDFDISAQVAVNAKIGSNLNFPINYNTLANFGKDNQLKLDYTGDPDGIIRRLEAGNVSFPNRSTLIPGIQEVFGLKIATQFGKSFITAMVGTQKSQRQSMNLQGGTASQLFEIKANEYEENRHFLLGQYFRKNYNTVMAKLPAVTTPVQILRMEVWVTNKNGTTTDTRDIVGFTNLGEPSGNGLPFNGANTLYSTLISNPSNRNPALVVNNLVNTNGLSPIQDFEKTFARKLDSTQYLFNRQAGYISLQSPLQPDEVLAVAFQYSYNGKIYQVGEFSQDLPPDSASSTQKVLFLKLLKATSQRPSSPIWGLMMKNVYSIGYGTLQPDGFTLDVLYQEPALGFKRYVPFGNKNLGSPIISLINLDRLNNQLDPQPDGKFDFVEGFTVLSQYSRVIFPVLEPFGRDLAVQTYTTIPANVRDTLYYALYDSIKAVAEQFPNLNRFVLKGSAKTSGSSEISLGYNIPRGSVTVSAGGRVLQEGVDYDINYDLGTLKITNTAITNAGLPVQVSFENDASFGVIQKSVTALRWDYQAINTAKEQLSLGATYMRLGERPYFTKVQLNEDPIRNTMYGVDVNFRKDLPRLTKLLDKLPFYQTKAPSNINAYVEAAYFKPGHAPQIGKGSKGLIYIDDFEGSKSGIDLRFPQNIWSLASVPVGATAPGSNIPLFPEASLNDDIRSGANRAKISWYQIEPTLQQYKGSNNPVGSDKVQLSDPRVRQIYQKEIFPQKTTGFGESQLTTFDLSYYPKEKGAYNFDAAVGSVDANNKLLNPTKRWGGLMRSIDQTDFETNNIEFIEFWVQDPFIKETNQSGGLLYFNLGNVSEDILKDGRRFYENGLPTPNAPSQVDNSSWGRVPRNPIQVTNAFSNDPNERTYQDVGLDGLTDTAELSKRQAYINQLGVLGVNAAALQKAKDDPSNDNYHYYRGDDLDAANVNILGRYKNFNNPQGNSPIASSGTNYSAAATLYPDAEDLNRDNTMNETEEYFQYFVYIKPPTDPLMAIGQNYIVDKKAVPITSLPDGTARNETWYQFRIPIESFDKKIGQIPDFKSIRFIRMFLTGFSDSITMRFGELQLTRNIWRRFQYKIDTTGNVLFQPTGATAFTVGSVNIEENDNRTPLPYRTPASIERQQTQSNNGVNLLQNEQAMSLQVCNLAKGDARAVIQTFAARDLRQFRKLNMFVHFEDSKKAETLSNGDMSAVIRVGSDFTSNYYEIKIPLRITRRAVGLNGSLDYFNSDAYKDTLWNVANSLDVDLAELVLLKQDRDFHGNPVQIYRKLQTNGQIYSIMGNPDLSQVRGILLGVENTKVLQSEACAEVWFNELRLSSIDENGGAAALARVDFTFADLMTLSLSANGHTAGFGNLEQRVNERYRDNFLQFDANLSLDAGKLLPKKAAISIPIQATYSQTVSKPQYDPLSGDIKLKDKLKLAPADQRDSIRNNAIDFTATKSLSITNMRKARTGTKKPKPWDVSNLDISASYLNIKAHNPLIENNEVTRYRGGLGYNYAPQTKPITPFKKLFRKTKTHWFDLVKDFNFNPLPAQVSFRADINRQFGAVRPRSIGASKYAIPETYDKYFTFQRDYIVSWPLTNSLRMDFTATNNSRIDEPYGRLDTREKKDTVRRNLLDGGRNTLYNHAANFSYTLPTSKFPLLDWTTVNLKYQASYRWIGASRLAPELGNILENGQQQEASVQLDFTRLYSKLKFFRIIDQPKVPKNQVPPKNKDKIVINPLNQDGTKKTALQIKKERKAAIGTRRSFNKARMPYVGTMGRIFGRLITSVKQVEGTISENANTRLPGYTDSTQYVGQNWKSMAPGIDFILGRQPDTSWMNRAAAKKLITRDSNFNSLFTQTYDQRITASMMLEPLPSLNITVNISKTFNKNFSETFKDTTGTGNNFGHLSPYTNGGFDVSYIAFKTLFEKYAPNQISQTFLKFQDYRKVLSKRLGSANKYNATGAGGANTTPDAEGYYYGYGKYATDVLIPSFIAAYTGQDPEKVALIKQDNANIKSNPFRSILPRPNWKVDYNGLTKIKGLEKVFTNFTLSHGYDGHVSMNGFTSALLYQDVSRYGYPSFYDPQSKNYIPFFLVPNITIQESFQPLIGVDMMFTNQMQAKFEYAKTRQLSLSLIDFQLSEVRSTEFSIGAGYRKKGGLPQIFKFIKWPKFLGGGGTKPQNEINFRFDYKVRDNVTANSSLYQDNNYTTGGSKETTITPSIDYFVSSRVNVKLYFDQRRVKPYISSSAPMTNTRAGLQIRISLAP